MAVEFSYVHYYAKAHQLFDYSEIYIYCSESIICVSIGRTASGTTVSFSVWSVGERVFAQAGGAFYPRNDKS